MSSLNPIVGVSLCISALGAGLAYLAYNRDEGEDLLNEEEQPNEDKTAIEKKEEKPVENKEESDKTTEKDENEKIKPKPLVDEGVNKVETQNIKQDVEEEIKNKKTNMQQFLQETYEKTNQ